MPCSACQDRPSHLIKGCVHSQSNSRSPECLPPHSSSLSRAIFGALLSLVRATNPAKRTSSQRLRMAVALMLRLTAAQVRKYCIGARKDGGVPVTAHHMVRTSQKSICASEPTIATSPVPKTLEQKAFHFVANTIYHVLPGTAGLPYIFFVFLCPASAASTLPLRVLLLHYQ